jgi:hypothetical protein
MDMKRERDAQTATANIALRTCSIIDRGTPYSCFNALDDNELFTHNILAVLIRFTNSKITFQNDTQTYFIHIFIIQQ